MNPLGHRGYIASRPVRGSSIPQHVQNLVIRDFAQRNGLQFKLSATEYAMAGSFMMLDAVLDELPQLDGAILYSMFMLPDRPERRRAVYARVLAEGKILSAAVENLTLKTPADVRRWEDILLADRFAAREMPAF